MNEAINIKFVALLMGGCLVVGGAVGAVAVKASVKCTVVTMPTSQDGTRTALPANLPNTGNPRY